MKHLHTFESFLNESLNEAIKLNLREIPKLVKEYVDRAKYIGDLKKKSWWTAADIITITDKDFDVKGKSASGNYMLLGLYELSGPVYKIEWAAVRPDMVAIFSKEIDKRTWEKLLKAHQRQMVDPKNLTPADVNKAGNLMAQFLTTEINMAVPPKPVKGNLDPTNADSVKMEVEGAHKDADVSIISGGKVRVDFYSKRAGDGRNVAKTNLLFIIDPAQQTVEFKNPDSSKFFQVKYQNMKDISQFFKDSIKGWVEDDKKKYDAMQQNALSQDR